MFIFCTTQINETFQLDSLGYNVIVANVSIRNYSESSFAISISFSLHNDTVLDYVVDTFENEDFQKNFIDNINSSTGINVRDNGRVLAFQPSCKSINSCLLVKFSCATTKHQSMHCYYHFTIDHIAHSLYIRIVIT